MLLRLMLSCTDTSRCNALAKGSHLVWCEVSKPCSALLLCPPPKMPYKAFSGGRRPKLARNAPRAAVAPSLAPLPSPLWDPLLSALREKPVSRGRSGEAALTTGKSCRSCFCLLVECFIKVRSLLTAFKAMAHPGGPFLQGSAALLQLGRGVFLRRRGASPQLPTCGNSNINRCRR